MIFFEDFTPRDICFKYMVSKFLLHGTAFRYSQWKTASSATPVVSYGITKTFFYDYPPSCSRFNIENRRPSELSSGTDKQIRICTGGCSGGGDGWEVERSGGGSKYLRIGIREAETSVSTKTMKMIVFCNVAPCSLVESNRRFIRAYCLNHQGPGGSRHLRNVGQCLPDYTVQHSRRQSSSYSPLWGHEISY
jgi:hypothetical protein